MAKLSLEMAKHLLAVAEQKARQMGIASNIAIVDDGGNLIAFVRMDNARIAGISISQDKAWTSVSMQMPTANLTQAAQPGGPSFGVNTTNHGRIVILGGGIPLIKGDRIVGAIGVSGGTSVQDTEVSNSAVQAFQAMHDKPNPNINARIGNVHFQGSSR
ncbi:heme-binding protein [Paenibacillus sp. GCM10027626]|uniref:GlcG/HbpS family heme-binding protein n=1 Tax=Paenibacillus sp. GCM10027626 TaxID=3273411 RepID=UPI00363D77A9